MFNILPASFLNIVFVQKSITELTLEFKRAKVMIHSTIARCTSIGKLARKAITLAVGRKLRIQKQMTTTKQDFACLISPRTNFILVKFFSEKASCVLFLERANFFNNQVNSCVSKCDKEENKRLFSLLHTSQ